MGFPCHGSHTCIHGMQADRDAIYHAFSSGDILQFKVLTGY